MTKNYIYNLNLKQSKLFSALNELYLFYTKGQEKNWDNWVSRRKSSPPKETLDLQKLMKKFIDGQYSSEGFRPAVRIDGVILGNEISFLHAYYSGREDFFDWVG